MPTRTVAAVVITGTLVAIPYFMLRSPESTIRGAESQSEESEPGEEGRERSLANTEKSTLDSLSVGVDSIGFAAIVSSSELVQGCRFRGRRIDFVSHEYNPVLEEWERFDANYSASFDISTIATKQSYELMVGGFAPRNAEDVIERWTVGLTVGMVTLGTPYSTAQIGTPLPGNPGATIGFVGGEHIPLSSRTSPPPEIQRDELYRGDAFNGIRAMAADPEGRFLLIISEDSRLMQFDLASELVTTVFTVAEIPSLVTDHHIRRRQHLSKGRMFFLESDLEDIEDHNITVLIDANNDGVFTDPEDSIEFHDMLSYLTAGYGENSNFSADFINF